MWLMSMVNVVVLQKVLSKGGSSLTTGKEKYKTFKKNTNIMVFIQNWKSMNLGAEAFPEDWLTLRSRLASKTLLAQAPPGFYTGSVFP